MKNMKIKSRLYKKIFYYFLKPRPHGSLWCWYPLQDICEKEGHVPIKENRSNGYIIKCNICEKWLGWDIINWVSHNDSPFVKQHDFKTVSEKYISQV